MLGDARELHAGDQVSVKHLEAIDILRGTDLSYDDLLTVTKAVPRHGWDDRVCVEMNGQPVLLPTGTVLPAAAYEYEGELLGTAELNKKLLDEGDLSFRRRNDPMLYNAARINELKELHPGDPGYITPIIPTTTGATL